MRKMWRPRNPELREPCPGCPFVEGNDAEFGKVVRVLRAALGLGGRVTAGILRHARRIALGDIRGRGDFVCHHSAYDVATGERKPASEARQCAGAARLFRAGEV